MAITKEEYESLARLGFAVQRQAEEWLGEMLPGQRVLLVKLVAYTLMECLQRHGPQGQNHKAEMVAGYERVVKRLREEGETFRVADNPQGPQSPSLGPLEN